jgi:uncharacterized integral membrane protein
VRPRRPSSGQVEQWQPRLWLVLVGLLAMVAYVLAFVVRNDDEIEIDFVFFSATISLIWAILLMLGIGVLGGVLLSQVYRRRRREEPG